MISDEIYSSKDSNHNRKLEEKINKRWAIYTAIMAMIFFILILIYFNNMNLHEVTVNSIKNPTIDTTTRVEPGHEDEAKPYDPTVPPYEQ
jgi:hypothetical protein